MDKFLRIRLSGLLVLILMVTLNATPRAAEEPIRHRFLVNGVLGPLE